MGSQVIEAETSNDHQSVPGVRGTGTSAGELFGAIWQELQPLMTQDENDITQMTKTILLRLQKDGLITPQDQEKLEKIADLLSAQSRGEAEDIDVATQTRSSYQTMLADKSSSQTALSIMSIVADYSVTSVLNSVVPAKERKQQTKNGDVLLRAHTAHSNRGDKLLWGAAVGATIGASAGGFGALGGAFVGALIGLFSILV